MKKLTQAEIHAIHNAAIEARLDRDELLMHLPMHFRSSLHDAKSPRNQLMRDLDAMNGVVLLDGCVPMEAWLRNAIHMCVDRPEKVIFENAHNRLKGTSPSEIGSLTAGQTRIQEGETIAIDFGIVTAIKVERQAVCAALGLTDDHRVNMNARVYWRGRLPLKNGEFYEIVVAQLPDMANIDAAVLTTHLINDWHPGAALMVGIAGSADRAVHLGDVVPGSEIFYYERGKETASGLKPEPKMISADKTLWSRVIALPDRDGDLPIARPDGSTKEPKVCLGAIASGERVIADATMRDMIKAGHRKIIAIEMEGYGFSQAVLGSGQSVKHLVIRGICDEANENKGDEWHTYAAAAAASYMRHFLLDKPLEPRNRP